MQELAVLLFSLDSGVFNHMTGMRDVFLTISETDSDCYVTCGVDTIHVVKWDGTVLFHLETEGYLEMAGVRHVPELKMNLLSISTLEDKGMGLCSRMDRCSYI